MFEKLATFVVQSTITKEKREREKKKELKSASKSSKDNSK